MKRFLLILTMAAAAFGGDLSGKWSGKMAMRRGDETRDGGIYMALTQDGSKITGTAGPSLERQYAIKVGSVDANTIKLEVAPENDGPIYIELTVDGDRLTGTLKGESEGQPLTGKLEMKREK